METTDLALAALAFVFAVLWLRARSSVRRGNVRRGTLARRAELEAEDVLAEWGYAILDRQITHEWPMDVDGERVYARLRADLRVAKDGELFIAEVKAGVDAGRPTFPGTRRQLLEYLLAFDVHGVLLVDMVERRVSRIEFPRVDLAE